jgi:hypothetical protein
MSKLINISDSSLSGDNTIITTAAEKKQKIFKATISVESNITGAVLLKCGAVTIGKVRNPIAGGPLVIFNMGFSLDTDGTKLLDYYAGAAGEDIVLNLPDTTAVTLTLIHEDLFISSITGLKA